MENRKLNKEEKIANLAREYAQLKIVSDNNKKVIAEHEANVAKLTGYLGNCKCIRGEDAQPIEEMTELAAKYASAITERETMKQSHAALMEENKLLKNSLSKMKE